MEAIKGMKVFRMTDEEWYVAANVAEAIAALASDMDCETEEELRAEGYLGEDGPIELTDEQMQSYEMTVESENQELTDEKLTFAQFLESDAPTSAGQFCTTNF